MRILITGGAGFIGSKLARHLSRSGHEIVVLDALTPQIHGQVSVESDCFSDLRSIATLVRGDVRDRDALRGALAGTDAVVHLAAETGTGQSMYEIDRYAQVNVGGTALLLDVLANEASSVSKLVVASSRSIYGEGRYRAADGTIHYPGHRSDEAMSAGRFEIELPGVPGPLQPVATDEGSKLHPSSVYGISKMTQEQLVMTVSPTIGIEPVALRYQNVYGPGQSLSNPYTGILSIFSGLMLNGERINVFEDGLESRDFVFVDDVVRATGLAIETSGADRLAVNVGSGVQTTVLDVVDRLAAGYGLVPDYEVTGNYRLGDIRHNVADLALAESTLGFVPETSFADGIQLFASWVKSQEVSASGFAASIEEMRRKRLFK